MNRRDLRSTSVPPQLRASASTPHMRRGPFRLDAIGFNLLPVAPGGAQIVSQFIPFAGEGLARPTVPYLRRFGTARRPVRPARPLEVFTWGPSFPDIRRLHPTFSRLRFRGRLLSLPDWAAWSDPVHEAWSHHQRRVDHELGDAVTRVDGIEPYSWLLPPPPNHFTAMMAADLIGARWP